MSGKIAVALFGHGFLGKFHAQKVDQTSLAELKVIVEKSEERIIEARKNYPGVRIVSDVSECWDDFQAAIVALPTALHYLTCCSLLKQKKHIFCEKPVTALFSESKKLLELAQSTQHIFHVGQSERHHPLVNQLRERPYLWQNSSLQIERVASFKGRATDTDVVHDVMVHDLDLLLNLTGKTPTIKRTQAQTTISGNIDSMMAWLEFSDGPMVCISVSRHHVEEKRVWTFFSKQGVTELDFFRVSLRETLGAEIVHETYEKRDHLLEEQKNFFLAIEGRPYQACSLSEGANAVHWCENILSFKA